MGDGYQAVAHLQHVPVPASERLLQAIRELSPRSKLRNVRHARCGSSRRTPGPRPCGIQRRMPGLRYGPDHTQGNVENNSQEIATAIRLANEYPDIVKAIAVGNEAMVQWAVTYFVYPKTILKWVNHLQAAKASGAYSRRMDHFSDNYESWGGGNPIYHTKSLRSSCGLSTLFRFTPTHSTILFITPRSGACFR